MRDRQVKSVADQELTLKVESIQKRVHKARVLLKSAQTKFEKAERHRENARKLRRATNS